MQIKQAVIQMEGAALEAYNPLPVFREREHDRQLGSDGSLTEQELEGLGKHAGFRVLPYCMQEPFSQERKLREYETVVMENDCLRAEFLPRYGGRLWSLFDKKKKRELLFRNPVFQPANLAIRNAWFSGGIEWNVGQLGHACHTCDDVFFAKCRSESGEEFLRLYDYVRTTGLFWQVDFHLPEGSEFLYVHVWIGNDGDGAQPLYWWTNMAVREKGTRIFSGSEDLIFIDPESLVDEGGRHRYGHGRMPCLPGMAGVDVSYPLNFPYTSEYFFQNPKDCLSPWEAAAYPDGFVFLERSTQPLRTRKMFCWGTHAGGRNWLDRLSKPGEGDYVEIQAGLTPTQSHGADLQGHSAVEFTQAFGSFQGAAEAAFREEWSEACQEVRSLADEALPPERIAKLDGKFERDAQMPCGEILHQGHGWAALEGKRRAAMKEAGLPARLEFPEESMGEEERRWAALLDGKEAAELEAAQLPASWMTDEKWRPVLERALRREPCKAWPLVALGVLEYENENFGRAAELWEKSLEICPTVIALRCLSYECGQKGEAEQALEKMKRAFSLEGDSPSPYLVRELLALMKENGHYEELWETYAGLPGETAADERIMILACAAAVELGKDEFLEKVYRHHFSVIREGENQMCEIWFRHQAMKRKRQGDTRDFNERLRFVKSTYEPPETIDYRLAQAK